MSNQNDPIDDALLDRLADDELGGDEKRRLLASLDDEPGGWRRCALAFLEAQAWRGTLGAVMSESATAATAGVRPTGNRSEMTTRPRSLMESAARQPPGLAAWKPLGIAAGIMLAFTVGMVWRGGVDSGRESTRPVHRTEPMDPGGALVALPQPENNRQSNGAQPSLVGVPASPSNAVASDDAILLVVGGDGTPKRQIRVPLIESPAINEQFGRHLQPAVPETVRPGLERAGYRVESQRRFAPVWAGGGQRMLVPVDDTKIVPVSRTVY